MSLAGLAQARSDGGRAAGFNGVITFRATKRREAGHVRSDDEGPNKVRLDGFGSSQGTMIIDNDAKIMIIVEPDEEAVHDDDPGRRQADAGHDGADDGAHEASSARRIRRKYKFEKTGKTEIVAGAPCEVWHGEYSGEDGEKDEGEACVAHGRRVRAGRD